MTPIRAVLAALFLCLTTALSAATFTVTSSAETGPGTLKQAILDANATPGADQIVFAVVSVFVEPTGLTSITDQVDIDGALGGGAIVDISMPAAFDVTGGFKFMAGSSNSSLRNVFIHDVPNASVVIASTVLGVTLENNSFGSTVRIDGEGNDMTGNVMRFGAPVRVGGDFNVLLRNTTSLISIEPGATDNEVGRLGEGNTIRNLTAQGTNLNVHGNTFPGGSGAAITMSAPVTSSSIAYNTISGYATGINVVSATGVLILSNSIFNTGIPIDLGGDGPTANDPGPDADTGANNLQNYPVLTSATLFPGNLVVEGTLTGTPLTSYVIELFADSAADPEARTLLSSGQLTTDATGTLTFTQTVVSPLPTADDVVTATATNRSTDDTSEVSPAVAIDAPGELALSSTAYSVDEADGSVTITVNRTGGSEGTVTIDYATENGAAAAPADFTATSGTLTFGPGVTTQTFLIPIVSDSIPEGAETFGVLLSNPTGGANPGTATAAVTIDSHLPGHAIPTASTWALLLLAAALAAITLNRIAS